jgi:hypothetical protein
VSILNVCLNNKFSYEDIKSKSRISLLNTNDVFINVIVGFRNRGEFLEPLIDSFNDAISFYKSHSDNDVCLTFVEHDYEPRYESLLIQKVNYLWSPGNITSQYSRSFAYNFAQKYSNAAKFYLFHDLDILVKKDFFLEVLENLNGSKCLQPYGNRHVLYMSKELTDKVINKKLDINQLHKYHEGVSPPNQTGSKGGSIFVEKETFEQVGGFDPEIFWGYAAEDQMFWDKVSAITNIGYADNPSIEMYHMWHPPTEGTNPLLFYMENMMVQFRNMNMEEKINFLNMKKEYLNEQ